MAYDYVLAGAQGTGAIWYEARQALITAAAWKINVYVVVLVPLIAVLGFAARHTLPVIDVPVMAASSHEASWTRTWYRPGSIRLEGDNLTWSEGRYKALVNKSLISKRGWLMGYGITTAVERNVNPVDLVVTYDTHEIETYRSQTLNHRLKLEIQQRYVAEHRAAGVALQPRGPA